MEKIERGSLLSQMVVENKISYKECEYLNNHPEAPMPGEEGYVMHYDINCNPVDDKGCQEDEQSINAGRRSNPVLDQKNHDKAKTTLSNPRSSRNGYDENGSVENCMDDDQIFVQKMKELEIAVNTTADEIYEKARKKGMTSEDIISKIKKFKLPRSVMKEVKKLAKRQKLEERKAEKKLPTRQVSFHMNEKIYYAVKVLNKRSGSNLTRFLNEAALEKILRDTSAKNNKNNASVTSDKQGENL
jgi:hypothetical protein